MTNSGSLYNLPFTTPTLPVPTGSGLQYITSYVTASSTSSLVPTYDINASIYKRIYNSVPYILKKKEMMKVLTTDPLVTYFNLKRGDIIRIIRYSEQSGKNVAYRIVAKGAA